MRERERLNQLNYRVIGCCMEVHQELGPGLLESIYEEALAYELNQAGLQFERQKECPLHYKATPLLLSYRIDFYISHSLILELKAVGEILPVHQAQLLTYLRLEQKPLGLLINFNVPALKAGIHRIANGDLFRRA